MLLKWKYDINMNHVKLSWTHWNVNTNESVVVTFLH